MKPALKPGPYCGWVVSHNPGHPITGQWRAVRFGVGMGNSTAEGLKAMIDQRMHEEREVRECREKEKSA